MRDKIYTYFIGDIENFNSLHNKYANKTFVYGHEGMSVRGNFLSNQGSLFLLEELISAALSALDHNANVGRLAATTKDGQPRFSLECSRDGKRWYVRVVKEKKDGSWRDTLCDFVVQCVEKRVAPAVEVPSGADVKCVRGKVERPDKLESIKKHQSRMVHNNT